MPRRIIVAMSGGVDSSVTAALMHEQGLECVGVFMRNGVKHDLEHQGKPNKQGCCSVADAMDGGAVAASLGIPYYVLNFEHEFSRIIDYFVDEYARGRTPNPCVVCNNDLKFGRLFEYATDVGADAVATGHYAQVRPERGRWRLFRGADRAKDQSYYLFGLSQEQLSRCIFPVGGMTKSSVREHARRLNLRTRDKPESQEICFVPNNDYRTLLQARTPHTIKPGAIVNREGTQLAEHAGAAGFTIGQRRGLGIGGGTPLYVTGIHTESNTVVVGTADELLRSEMVVRRANFIGVESVASGQSLRAGVQVRYRHQPAMATIRGLVDGSLHVEFDEPVSAITPGQAAVFYDDDECLGGGWIDG